MVPYLMLSHPYRTESMNRHYGCCGDFRYRAERGNGTVNSTKLFGSIVTGFAPASNPASGFFLTLFQRLHFNAAARGCRIVPIVALCKVNCDQAQLIAIVQTRLQSCKHKCDHTSTITIIRTRLQSCKHNYNHTNAIAIMQTQLQSYERDCNHATQIEPVARHNFTSLFEKRGRSLRHNHSASSTVGWSLPHTTTKEFGDSPFARHVTSRHATPRHVTSRHVTSQR
jgi:hypothetical protein